MIEKILNKFGYYKITMTKGSELTEKEVLELFSTMGTNDTFKRFLRDICARDIKLYFQASNDNERQMIRGAHSRTNYFLALIKKSNETNK